MGNFLDFINKRKTIYEGFSDKNLETAIKSIVNILKKHISGKVLRLPGFIDTKSGQDSLSSVNIIINTNNGGNYVLQLNWTKDSDTKEVYSINIIDSTEYLLKGKAKSLISIYTLGSSIVYFLPAIWYMINGGDFKLSQKEVIDMSKQIYKNSNIKESYFYVGAYKYRVLENLDNKIIKDAFLLEFGPDNEVKQFKKQKAQEMHNAYSKRKDSPEDMEEYKKIQNEYNEIRSAINGGAFTMKELKMAIKHNINISDEISTKDQEAEEKFKEEREDPEQVFKKMQGYIKMVIKGINPSVILCGAPGVGKTYRVKKQLKANNYMEGHNMFTIKGKCTPRRLYLALFDYQEKGQIIVIDDADALVGPNAPEDCINILKAALDSTSDNEGRLVSYGVSGKLLDDEGQEIPKRFYYNGSIIVITNWNAGKLDTALRGRSYIQDINFTTDEVLQIIKKLMPSLGDGKLSPESKIKAYDYLNELLEKGYDMEVSIRTFGICANIFEAVAGDPDFNDDDAKSMIKEQMKLQASRITGRGNKGKY